MLVDWVPEEFAGIDLGDFRLNIRFLKIMKSFATRFNANIPKSSESSTAANAAYRFFRNEKVEMDAIMPAHTVSLQSRAAKQATVLNIQDTSCLNYFNHKSKADAGHIGSSTKRPDSLGYWLHTGLAVTTSGIPLGITYQELWARGEVEKNSKNQRKSRLRNEPIEEKESFKWLEGAEASKSLLVEREDTSEHPKKVKVVQVADREADIFEFMQFCLKNSLSYLVRSKSERAVSIISGDKIKYDLLHEYIGKQPVFFQGMIAVAGNRDRSPKNVQISVRIGHATLIVPKSNRNAEGSKKLEPIETTVIKVTSRTKIDSKPLNWILLTDATPKTQEEIEEVINWYTLRWLIEMFFKTLKSGCKIEECRLSSINKM